MKHVNKKLTFQTQKHENFIVPVFLNLVNVNSFIGQTNRRKRVTLNTSASQYQSMEEEKTMAYLTKQTTHMLCIVSAKTWD